MNLVIVDPQNSFCDSEKGSLYVPNSENDMKHISSFVDKLGSEIKNIFISLDTHHLISIFHPLMWINNKNEHPSTFTNIYSSDIKNNIWYPILPELKEKYIKYCEELEKIGKHNLIIWPEHCLIGSEGSNVSPILYPSLLKWEEKFQKNINWIIKGMNINTENYSFIKSEVPDKNDISTLPNELLLEYIDTEEQIFILGEAGSHCVLESIKDIVELSDNKKIIEKIIFMEDCISPVSGFESTQENFVKEYKELGMKVAKSTDF